MSLADLIPAENRSPGLTASELERAQEEAGAAFPPDLAEFLMDCLPVGNPNPRRPAYLTPTFADWRNNPAEAMSRWRDKLVRGILFNVESESNAFFDEGRWVTGAFWQDAWGERPGDAAGRRARVATLLDAAPWLIPVCGNCGIPNDPLEAGNPLFDVVQIDIIVAGSNLEDFLRRAFHGGGGRPPVTVKREIRFWSALA